MRRTKFIYLVLTALLVWSCVLRPAPVYAALSIEAPATAPQGSAVLIRLSAGPGDERVHSATVRWLDASFAVPLVEERGRYTGLALLPMPLEGTQKLELQASAGKQSVTTDITPVKVAWPKQEIKVESKYVAPPPEVQKRIEDEQRKVRALLAKVSPERYWNMPCLRPVPGEVSSVFGGQRVFNGQPRSRHRGADMRAGMGEPILAMAGGRVAIAEEHYFSGNVVFIDHGQGLVSLYAHMSAIQVAAGDVVQAGQQIGLIGATGRVTGPHLHWGVNILGKPVDPLSLLSVRVEARAGAR